MISSDNDHMSVEKATVDDVPIFTVEHENDDGRYVKLRVTSKYRERNQRWKEIQYLDRSYFLDSVTFVDETAVFDDYQGEMHGPAYKHGPKPKDGENLKHYNNVEIDSTSVFKYPGRGWPSMCDEWFSREERKYDWPPPKLLEEIQSKGCHIAPVGRENTTHVKAKTDIPFMLDPREADLEWRLSFSVAETALCKSLPPTLRYVFVLLKILKKVYFPPDVITTYHLKQLIYWKSESKPVSLWREDRCVLYVIEVLDRLTECAKKKFLPHYIMPSSNVFSDTEDKQLEELAVTVENISTNIFDYLQNALKRMQSLQWMSHLYRRNIVFAPHASPQHIQDPNNEKPKEIIEAMLKVFQEANNKVRKRISLDRDEVSHNVRTMMNVVLLVYEILSAKTLYYLWELKNCDDREAMFDKDKFDKFCQENINNSEFQEEFNTTMDLFFGITLSGGSLMLAYETSSLVQLLEEKCCELSKETSASPQQALINKLPNVQEMIEARVQAMILETGGIPTEEDITRVGESIAREIFGYSEQLAKPTTTTKVEDEKLLTQVDLKNALQVVEDESDSSKN